MCFLKPGDRIGEITLHSIEIIIHCHRKCATTSTTLMSDSHGFAMSPLADES